MQIGMVELGRMGANMVGRPMQGGHACVVHDVQPAAIDRAAPVLSAAPYARLASCGEADFANRVLAAMRHGFGGHVEKGAPKAGG